MAIQTDDATVLQFVVISGSNHKCIYCGRDFSNFQDLDTHQYENHNKNCQYIGCCCFRYEKESILISIDNRYSTMANQDFTFCSICGCCYCEYCRGLDYTDGLVFCPLCINCEYLFPCFYGEIDICFSQVQGLSSYRFVSPLGCYWPDEKPSLSNRISLVFSPRPERMV